MKAGDIIYFRKFKRTPSHRASEFSSKATLFGVLLGSVPATQIEPTPDHLHRLLGTLGYLKFDDVSEFLSKEDCEKCIEKFKDKYYGTASLTFDALVAESKDKPSSEFVPINGIEESSEP